MNGKKLEPVKRDKPTKQNNEASSDSDISSEESDIIEEINVPLITELILSKKETYHYKIIDKYYKSLEKDNVLILIDIVEKKSKVSLRLIDWFVTKYAHKFKVRLEKKNNTSIDNGFNVHISYKAQLQSYKKKYFDPFRRRKRLKFKYFFDKEKQISLCTTIGQLNFFKWAFTNNIVEYVINNYEVIAKAMAQSNKIDKTKKKTTSDSDTIASVSEVVSPSDNTSGGSNKKVVKKPMVKKVKKAGISKPSTQGTMNLNFN